MPYRDPVKRAEYLRQYKISHPVSGEKQREYTNRYRERHRDEILARERKRNTASKRRERRYSLTEDRFNKMMAEQNGLCALCRESAPRDVDHCWKTGHVRGLLCRSCNLGLGMFKDRTELLQKAIEYLSRPTQRISDRYPNPRIPKTGATKINPEIVRSIRADYADGAESYADLGKRYQLHPVTIGQIVRRASWAQID